MSITDEIKKRSSIDPKYDSIKEQAQEIINAAIPEGDGRRRALPFRASVAFSGIALALILVGGIFLFTNSLKAKGKDAPAKLVDSDDPANSRFGFFYFHGKIYALQNEDQKKFVEEHKDGTEVSVKEIAKYLGILEEEPPYTIEDIYRVLGELDANAGVYEIITALDSVAGACDVEGGSGVTHYWYTTPEGYGLTVLFNSVTLGYESQFRRIFIRGLGFKREGWTDEEVEQYRKSRGIK